MPGVRADVHEDAAVGQVVRQVAERLRLVLGVGEVEVGDRPVRGVRANRKARDGHRPVLAARAAETVGEAIGHAPDQPSHGGRPPELLAHCDKGGLEHRHLEDDLGEALRGEPVRSAEPDRIKTLVHHAVTLSAA